MREPYFQVQHVPGSGMELKMSIFYDATCDDSQTQHHLDKLARNAIS